MRLARGVDRRWLVAILVGGAALVAGAQAQARPDRAPPINLVAEALGVDLTRGVRLTPHQRGTARAAGRRLVSLCPDCRPSTIDEDGPCGWARTNRILIRNAVAAGQSEEQIVRTYVATYGRQVLARQMSMPVAIVYWMGSAALILASLIVLLAVARRVSRPVSDQPAPATIAPGSVSRESAAILKAELDELD